MLSYSVFRCNYGISNPMHGGSGFCGIVLFSCVAMAQQPATPTPQNAPVIQILQGDGAINSIRLHRGHDPEVRVLTQDGEPIAGATVTFVLPASGPSATFGTGLSTSVTTDSHGAAAGRGLRPNGVAGQFHIRVTTSWQGAPAVATLTQTNAEPVLHSGNTKKIAIIILIAGAAAGGAAAALGSHSSSSNTSTPAGGTTAGGSTGGTITAGTPTIGPPH